MSVMIRTVLLAVSAMVLSTGVSAQNLTDGDVRGFLNSMKELEVLSKNYDEPVIADDVVSMEDAATRMMAPFSSGLEQMRGHAAYGQMLDIVRDNGFSGAEHWAGVGDRVMRAVLALTMEANMSGADAKIASALRELEASDLPEDQKTMMRNMMQTGNQMLQTFSDVPAADKAAVTPYLSEFENLGQAGGP